MDPGLGAETDRCPIGVSLTSFVEPLRPNEKNRDASPCFSPLARALSEGWDGNVEWAGALGQEGDWDCPNSLTLPAGMLSRRLAKEDVCWCSVAPLNRPTVSPGFPADTLPGVLGTAGTSSFLSFSPHVRLRFFPLI